MATYRFDSQALRQNRTVTLSYTFDISIEASASFVLDMDGLREADNPYIEDDITARMETTKTAVKDQLHAAVSAAVQKRTTSEDLLNSIAVSVEEGKEEEQFTVSITGEAQAVTHTTVEEKVFDADLHAARPAEHAAGVGGKLSHSITMQLGDLEFENVRPVGTPTVNVSVSPR